MQFAKKNNWLARMGFNVFNSGSSQVLSETLQFLRLKKKIGFSKKKKKKNWTVKSYNGIRFCATKMSFIWSLWPKCPLFGLSNEKVGRVREYKHLYKVDITIDPILLLVHYTRWNNYKVVSSLQPIWKEDGHFLFLSNAKKTHQSKFSIDIFFISVQKHKLWFRNLKKKFRKIFHNYAPMHPYNGPTLQLKIKLIYYCLKNIS